jgi:hypothetical protein
MKYINKSTNTRSKGNGKSIKANIGSKNKSSAKLSIGLKLAATTAEQLTGKAASMHVSRNALMTLAIERCLLEDVWRIGESNIVARNLAANPDSRLVELSNALLAMAFIADKLLIRNTKKQRDELGRICMDAKANLSVIRGSLGC